MRPISFKRHRFPPEIIRHAIWLYARFTLSFRDVEELLAERGIDASYETVRRGFRKFGPAIAAVMGGVGSIATKIGRPGLIKHTGAMQRLVFGEYDGRRSARAEALLDACKRGGINAALSGDIRREIWEKFVFLVGLSATTTTMRLLLGPIHAHAQTRAFLF